MTLPGWQIEVPEVFERLEHDVIMCVKQYWSDSHLAQPPLLVLPAVIAATLEAGGPKITCARTALGDESVKQFKKAADKFEAHPWRYKEAAEYIRHWVAQNQAAEWPSAKPLSWVVEDVVECDRKWLTEVHDDWAAYAPEPAKIQIVRKPVKGQGGQVPSRGRGRGVGSRGGCKGRGRKRPLDQLAALPSGDEEIPEVLVFLSGDEKRPEVPQLQEGPAGLQDAMRRRITGKQRPVAVEVATEPVQPRPWLRKGARSLPPAGFDVGGLGCSKCRWCCVAYTFLLYVS